MTAALPVWYLSAAVAVVIGGLHGAVVGLPVVIATFCLAVGTARGVRHRQWPLLWFATSAILSHGLMFCAGLYRGQFEDGAPGGILLAFLVTQIGLLGFFIWWLKDMRRNAVLFSVFFLSYALAAAFFATMAFVDRWI